jgi:hypothetical protein
MITQKKKPFSRKEKTMQLIKSLSNQIDYAFDTKKKDFFYSFIYLKIYSFYLNFNKLNQNVLFYLFLKIFFIQLLLIQ